MSSHGVLGLLLVISIFQVALGATLYPQKRTQGEMDAATLQQCIGSNGMKRQLRSNEGLNMYLIGLAKCVASVGRPRFGKRSSASDLDPTRLAQALKLVLAWYNNKNTEQQLSAYPIHHWTNDESLREVEETLQNPSFFLNTLLYRPRGQH